MASKTTRPSGCIVEPEEPDVAPAARVVGLPALPRPAGDDEAFQLMAHFCQQLRVPINGLLGMFDLMLEVADGDLRDHLQATRLCARELAEKVNIASEFSAGLRHHPRPLPVTPFDLCETIEAVVSDQTESAWARRVEIYCDFPETLPPIVEGPLDEFRRVLSLLLTILVNESTGGEIGVSTTHLRGPRGALLTLRLSSTSAHSTPGQSDRFRRLFGGGGRDLAPGRLEILVCSRLLDRIGAVLELNPDKSGGLAFELTLPLAIADGMFEDGDLLWDERLKGRTAAVVSANEGVARSVRALLRQFGLRADSGDGSPWVLLVDVDALQDLPIRAHGASHRISFGHRRTDGRAQPDMEKPVRRYLLYDLLISLLMPQGDGTPSAERPAYHLMLG